jgi:uncharacterized protein (DUF427 family)
MTPWPGHVQGVAELAGLAYVLAMAMDTPAPETVRDYPRPPRIEPVSRRLRIVFADQIIAETRAALRVLETHHPPTYYLPVTAFHPGVLQSAPGSSFCEWKGHSRYWSIAAGGRIAHQAAWDYPAPTPAFAALRDHVAVYAGKMDACFVGEERVRPQPGGFYGGWITDDLVGPFKGEPGTAFW